MRTQALVCPAGDTAVEVEMKAKDRRNKNTCSTMHIVTETFCALCLICDVQDILCGLMMNEHCYVRVYFVPSLGLLVLLEIMVHHFISEQILKKKKEAQEEAEALRTAQQQVTEALSKAQVDQEKAHQETKTLQAEVAALRLSEETAQSTLKKQLEAYSEELSDLKGQLNEKNTLAEKLEKEFQVMRQENARLQRLEEEKKRSQCSDQEEKSVLTELQSLQIRYDEETRSNAELKATIENMKAELQKLRWSEESLRASSSNSEEKQKVAETRTVQLEEQVASLTQEVANLKLTVAETQTNLESSQEKDSLQERINIAEAAKCLAEQELQKCRRSLEDAKARTEILESELQAKAQELTMSNTSITELDMKVKQAESDLSAVDRSQTEEMEELKKALAHHNQEVRVRK